MINLRRYFPPAPISNYVSYYFRLRDSFTEPEISHLSLPDNCPQLVFNLGRPYLRESPFICNSFKIIKTSVLKGLMTKAVKVKYLSDPNIICVKFKPYGLYPLLGMRLYEFTDHIFSLENVFGMKGILLEKKILDSSNDSEIFYLLDQFFLQMIQNKSIDPLIESIVCTISSGNNILIEQLENAYDLSLRTIEKRFKSKIGISPKVFYRIMRFNEFLSIMGKENYHENLKTITDRCNFFDQAHLIKDFKLITSITPRVFFNSITEYEKMEIELFTRDFYTC